MTKIFCSDLDGTLLNKQDEISEKDLYIIQKILINNYFVIASGRRYRAIRNLLCKFSSYNLKNLFIISSEGQLIYDGHGNIIYHQDYLLRNDIKKVFNNQSLFHLYSEDCDYFFENNIFKRTLLNTISYLKKQFKNKKYISKNYILNSNWDKHKIDKIRCSSLTEQLYTKYNVHTFFDNYLEITSLKTNKYFALKWLSMNLNVNDEDIVVLGDDANDINLAKNIKYFYAVQNANNEIKKEAYYVLRETNNDDPLSSVYMHYTSINNDK